MTRRVGWEHGRGRRFDLENVTFKRGSEGMGPRYCGSVAPRILFDGEDLILLSKALILIQIEGKAAEFPTLRKSAKSATVRQNRTGSDAWPVT